MKKALIIGIVCTSIIGVVTVGAGIFVGASGTIIAHALGTAFKIGFGFFVVATAIALLAKLEIEYEAKKKMSNDENHNGRR